MRTINRWEQPFRGATTLQEQINRVFGDVVGRAGEESNLTLWAPAVDIYETEQELVVKADLPDVNPQDLDIRVENNILTIRGERKFENKVNDENYLRVIMQNLTSNAIKVLKDQPDATIEWNAKKEGDNTVLSIADNGPGLSFEHQETLHEALVAENARDGFGLHVVRDLAKAIHCRLDVRSEPGKGTTFSLILPPAA